MRGKNKQNRGKSLRPAVKGKMRYSFRKGPHRGKRM